MYILSSGELEMGSVSTTNIETFLAWFVISKETTFKLNFTIEIKSGFIKYMYIPCYDYIDCEKTAI